MPIIDRIRGLVRAATGRRAYPIPLAARLVAGFAAVLTLAGAGVVVAAVVRDRRLWFDGYVSEAGVGPYASGYRLGIVALGVALILLGVALASTLPAVTVLLTAGGLLASLSGSVSCSPGCPLPPYESATASDLVHAAASVLAVGAVVLAMLSIAVLAADPGLRRISRVTAWVIVPLLATMGASMLIVGHGHLTGLLERTVLSLATGWALTTCVRLAGAPPPSRTTSSRTPPVPRGG